ncbi:MAG: DUF3084 domain-containing protein [Merismopedia sp. SIO2A8]|nr:DUF3084 domain-containing protein [Merismopedia sp. SIO2A8]
MATGVLFIVAMLILGGSLATAGDRIGMKVGKARLSLFNMRPRQTATLVTIFTGGLISVTTLGILFLLSEQLRTGVFELNDIIDELNIAKADLNAVQRERDIIDRALDQSRTEQEQATEDLRVINQSLQESRATQAETEAQLTEKQAELTMTQSELSRADQKFRQTQAELQQVSQQTMQLRDDIQALQQERRAQSEALRQKNEDLLQQDAQIFEKTQQLRDLEIQRAILIDELQTLRAGDVALFRNQPLAVGVVSNVAPAMAAQTVDQVLRRANQVVLQEILPGTQPIERQVVLITNAEVETLIDQLQDGREYVIRILSAGNYLVGEPCVAAQLRCIQVSAEAVLNDLIFRQGETIAATAIDPSFENGEQLRDRFELLISATQFRARQAGVFADTLSVAGGQDNINITRDFFEQLLEYQESQGGALELSTVASVNIYRVGPLNVELVMRRNGAVILSTALLRDDEADEAAREDGADENAE